MSRPGFVLEVDDRTPPLVVHEGEGFRLENFPLGTRVIYPPESLPAIDDVDGAIREALLHPVDQDPLPTQLRAGMRLTIAFDDLSLPLPPMRAPDIRQRIIEQVLTMAAEAGVDDVQLIAANALHRRMTPAELRHIVGERVWRSFGPQGLLYNHDAEDRDNLLHIGLTDQGEDVEINRRAAESDLLVYVNVNLVAMDGGHKSVPIGLASYKSLRHHHNAKTMVRSHSFMDHKKSHLHHSAWRMGRLLKEHLNIFQIETTLNNDVFPAPYDFLMKREWEWSVKDQATMLGDAPRALGRAEAAAAQDVPRPARAVRPHRRQRRRHRGRARADHRDRAPPAAGRGAGAVRRAGDGRALPRPLQRQQHDEPDPRDLHGAGLLLQLLPRPAGRPPRRRGDPLPPARRRASTSCTTRRTSTSTRRSSPSRPTRC